MRFPTLVTGFWPFFENYPRTKLDYWVIVYGGTNPTLFRSLDTIQHTAIRLTSRAYTISPPDTQRRFHCNIPVPAQRITLLVLNKTIMTTPSHQLHVESLLPRAKKTNCLHLNKPFSRNHLLLLLGTNFPSQQTANSNQQNKIQQLESFLVWNNNDNY